MINQVSNIKSQTEREKFKSDFNHRLIKFSVSILNFSSNARANRNLWSILDQLIRSSTSIGANIFEARSSSSRKDYIKFFEISLKSANETKFWLELLNEVNHNPGVSDLLVETNEISKIIGASVLTLKGKR